MLGARARAKWLPEPARAWTTTPPPGWDRGPTLDQRLDERDLKRAAERQWRAQGPIDIPS
jgi:hypothetical protein